MRGIETARQTVYGLKGVDDVVLDTSGQQYVQDWHTDPGWGYSGTPTNTTNGTTGVSTANALNILSGVTNSFTSIFKAIQPLPQGCQQVAGPYGVSTVCNPAGSAVNSLIGGGVGLSMNSMVLVGGGLLVLVLMMGKKG